ncbi:hypothetical protein [Lewinella sp. IMCC34183]|uniref:hypothetical protein n=1 Tax=Lewinella sp. IMCC34183 TaxID=2248762 RepID=UPI0013007F4F|nr:hypothetical protein [Lewinella sp. IMCC34183]
MSIDEHYELLTKLYLRLKGYLVSNLIIHSVTPGNHDSEIDILAVRFPYHEQTDRQVDVEDELDCDGSKIEFIIGEVKNKTDRSKIKFNRGLRSNRESIRKLISWLGCFPEVDKSLIDEFEQYLNQHRVSEAEGFATLERNFDHAKLKVKFLFFCPSQPNWEGKGYKYISGEQMLNFIWECLKDVDPVETCSRRYDFTGWKDLEQYVRIFKESEIAIDKSRFEAAVKDLK